MDSVYSMRILLLDHGHVPLKPSRRNVRDIVLLIAILRQSKNLCNTKALTNLTCLNFI